MISKKHFLAQIEKLNILYPGQLNEDQAMVYYEMLSPDFNDDQFDVALNLAVKNSFKFPTVAAFYHRDPLADALQSVYSPVTQEESARIRKALERAENGK